MKLKVEARNLNKSFDMISKQYYKLLDLLSLKRKKGKKVFTALRNINFKVYEGESIGIIGLNGSGKSTLSNILAQVIQPSSGVLNINGEPSLIAISAGLNNNLTGLENIELKCMMHGLSQQEIDNVRPDIIEFADIGDYIYQPVKNYSSGMRSRLGFAIAVHTDPDILIIDEALSVGDSTFTQKCLLKMNEFKEKGKTIFFISHSTAQVKKFCEKIIWMDFGEIKEFGPSDEVAKNYREYVSWFNGLSEKEKSEFRKKKLTEQIQMDFKTKDIKKRKKGFVKQVLTNACLILILSFLGVMVLLGNL